VDEEHINEMMNSVDTDGDGQITFEEFKNSILAE
jgi:Ca2+-binding EF-hand superfamily protein